MAVTSESSFERFYRTRGQRWVSAGNYRTGHRVQAIVGVVFVFFAALLFASSFKVGPDAAALRLGAIGPFVAGLINMIVGVTGWMKAAHQSQGIQLSLEAKKYMIRLKERVSRSRFFNPKVDVLLGSPDLSLQLVESGCFQYNRIQGLLWSGALGGTAGKLAQSSQLAADEAISEVFHECAIWSRFPENSQAAMAVIHRKVQSMNELANRLEGICSRPPTIADRLATSSAMEGVLEELRLTEMAQVELGSSRMSLD